YTGTHDNNTVKGWFENEASDQERRRVFEYLGRVIPIDELAWEMVRTVMMSVADVAILPMQDLLGLGQEARMNCPSLYQGNWRWRASEEAFHPVLGQRLRKLTELYGRA
ncbi:MAG: 4-alpha-glucanotransferase, partial [Planctomycetota bacterium]